MTHAASTKRQFASDTWAGLCPDALEAMRQANVGHAPAYGDDSWTARAVELLRGIFETDCAAYFVPTGTAANALALAGMCRSYHSVLCHADAHIQTDECGAPEFLGKGIKLVTMPGAQGKLTPERIRDAAGRRRDIHAHMPRVVSISQATEVGTVYRREETEAVAGVARELGLLVHMDGARFANALAHLQIPAKAVTWQAGVDVLCLGGTKNGVALADLIVFFDRALARDFDYRRKQAGHLFSKMRFWSAAWARLLESGAWLRNAAHANRMARLLADKLANIADIRVLYPVEANAVFVHMPEPWMNFLHEVGWHFYTIADGQRLMCSWDTQPEDIEAFVADVHKAGP